MTARAPLAARALLVGTASGGFAVLALAAAKSTSVPLGTLALLGAAVILTELIQVGGDESSLDPVAQRQGFSFSSGIHLASVVIVGPWAAALVAAFGVLVVDGLRRSPLSRLVYNASVFSLAAIGGGYLFRVAGGTPGRIDLPADFLPLLLLAAGGYGINTLFVDAIVATTSRSPLATVMREALHTDLSSPAGEAAFGIALAVFALKEPWAIVVLVPLVLALYQAHARLATLHRETGRALETFANVVDERDSSTYRHSARVAEYVHTVAEALGLPASEVARLRRAGRLHDLGKISVDAAVIRKPGRLDGDEWGAMWMHPRLSARLLRRFRLAAEEARAVEFHHERADGRGYYGISPREIPLAAHFLVVADAYDAMTSDRPYREGMSPEEALREIEANIGSQFHPLVAKAFVAVHRGHDLASVLTPEEQGEITRARLFGAAQRARKVTARSEHMAAIGAIAALLAVAAALPLLAVPAGALAFAGFALQRLDDLRARRLAGSIRGRTGRGVPREELFRELAEEIAAHCRLRWAAFVSWRERELSATIELEWGAGETKPTATALTSWFVRDAEAASDLLVAGPGELGPEEFHVAVPLRSSGELRGYLVFAIAECLPRSVERALRRSAGELACAVLDPAVPPRPPLRVVATA